MPVRPPPPPRRRPPSSASHRRCAPTSRRATGRRAASSAAGTRAWPAKARAACCRWPMSASACARDRRWRCWTTRRCACAHARARRSWPASGRNWIWPCARSSAMRSWRHSRTSHVRSTSSCGPSATCWRRTMPARRPSWPRSGTSARRWWCVHRSTASWPNATPSAANTW